MLQAADEGRGPVLFGESLDRAREAVVPFMVGEKFPSVYLEHPLIGDPFLDVTVLYGKIEPGFCIESDAARGTEALIDWYANECGEYENISFGFELDTKKTELSAGAVHFQPRRHTELVVPFCKALGEPERAQLYLGLNERLPAEWQLSFFGMFRGRPGSPLRVCGYLDTEEREACAQDPSRLASVFDAIGFSAYDSPMLAEATRLMGVAPVGIDFQFDVWPDGSLGNTFAFDLQFGIEQPEAVLANFTDGPAAQLMGLLESLGVADHRWKLGAQAAFARAIPVELPDGSLHRYSFTLMPQWAKARWTDGVLQPSKLYFLAKAGLSETSDE